MADVAELGFKVDSRPIADASTELGKLSRSSATAESATARLGRESEKSARAMQQYAAWAARAGAAVAAAGVAAGAMLAVMVQRTLAAADEQAKLAARLGSTIDGLRGLQIAAGDAGVASGALNSSIEMLNSKLGEAAGGSGTAASALQRLGLSARDLIALDADARFAAIADQIGALGLSSSETAFILRELGIRSSEMTNLVMAGGDVIRQARAEVDAYGLSLSRVDAAQIEAANDAMSRIGRTIEAMSLGLTIELAPALKVAADAINELARDYGGLRQVAQDAARGMVDGLIDAIEWYQTANLEVARLVLRYFELRDAIIRASIAVQGLFGGSGTLDQHAMLAATEAQRQFVRELEATANIAGEVRRRIEEARAAAPLEILIGGGMTGPSVADMVAPVQEALSRRAELEAAAEAQRLAGLARELDALRQSLMTQEELERVSHYRRLGTLAEIAESRLISEAEHFGLRELLAAEHAERMGEIARQETDAILRAAADQVAAIAQAEDHIRNQKLQTASLTANLLQQMAGQSKAAAIAAIALNKGVAIANIAIQTAAAMSAAVSPPPLGLGPVAGVALAAKMKAFGAVQMALVAATGIAQAAGLGAAAPTGGVSGGRGAAPVAEPPPARLPSPQEITVRIDSKRTMFSREEIGELFDAMNEMAGDGRKYRIA